MKKISISKLLILLTGMLLVQQSVFGFLPERRKTTGDDEFGWLVAPTPIIMNGIGTALPVLGLFSNIWEGADLLSMQTLPGGDFEIQLAFVNQFPVFNKYFVPALSRNVLIQAGSMKGKFPIKAYSRGIDSDKEDYTLPLIAQEGTMRSLRFYFDEQRYHLNYNWSLFTSSTEKIFDNEGNEFQNIDTSERSSERVSYGGSLDFTDDKTDPRVGINFGIKRNVPGNTDKERSDYYVTDYSLTGYIPMFGDDTLVLNFFRSSATVTREGITDEATLRTTMSLDCGPPIAHPLYYACYAAETKRINERIAQNKYGTATGLGGGNRLQAFDANRFSAGHMNYRAIEYRFNFSSKEAPVNWYVLGGLKTIFQLAFFAEQGTVSDHLDELNSNIKSSYGIGFRTIISGIVYRLDVAMGEEGIKPTIFFFYPMDLDPVN